jgi:hypothetical protein
VFVGVGVGEGVGESVEVGVTVGSVIAGDSGTLCPAHADGIVEKITKTATINKPVRFMIFSFHLFT